MKVISFFTAKGGTGKTTFNVLLASYIKYRLGKRVMVLDFDYPEHNLSYMRRRDLRYLEREGIHYSEEDFFPVEGIDKMSAQELDDISRSFRDLSDVDYLILDFPGSFAADDPVTQLMAEGYIDLMVTSGQRVTLRLLEDYNQDGVQGIYCPETSASKNSRTATNDAISTAGTTFGGLVGDIASTVIRTGATIAKSASGEVSVSVVSGYEFYLVKAERR